MPHQQLGFTRNQLQQFFVAHQLKTCGAARDHLHRTASRAHYLQPISPCMFQRRASGQTPPNHRSEYRHGRQHLPATSHAPPAPHDSQRFLQRLRTKVRGILHHDGQQLFVVHFNNSSVCCFSFWRMRPNRDSTALSERFKVAAICPTDSPSKYFRSTKASSSGVKPAILCFRHSTKCDSTASGLSCTNRSSAASYRHRFRSWSTSAVRASTVSQLQNASSRSKRLMCFSTRSIADCNASRAASSRPRVNTSKYPSNRSK